MSAAMASDIGGRSPRALSADRHAAAMLLLDKKQQDQEAFRQQLERERLELEEMQRQLLLRQQKLDGGQLDDLQVLESGPRELPPVRAPSPAQILAPTPPMPPARAQSRPPRRSPSPPAEQLPPARARSPAPAQPPPVPPSRSPSPHAEEEVSARRRAASRASSPSLLSNAPSVVSGPSLLSQPSMMSVPSLQSKELAPSAEALAAAALPVQQAMPAMAAHGLAEPSVLPRGRLANAAALAMPPQRHNLQAWQADYRNQFRPPIPRRQQALEPRGGRGGQISSSTAWALQHAMQRGAAPGSSLGAQLTRKHFDQARSNSTPLIRR
eukprot:TRINITY_DN67695_c0_g1_i1.p1 TRINITY_DN67695_c0_g1~~TRINITY_DN67695_c0_g1_i1.p1  ORF type:complete len:325 (-),score=50.47 TRINITY_DN67695_c0_g1_i1:21-995(-)